METEATAIRPERGRLQPAERSERTSSIDVLRGAALLGIALMNVIFSGLPAAADFNPKVSGGATGLNLAAFCLQYILFDGKMRGLFSMMFGASAWLLVERGRKRGAGIETAEIYYRRLLWLMLFGIAHAYLIWHGDILYPYALLGLILFPLLRLKPRTLLAFAGVLVALMTANDVYNGFHLRKIYALAAEADKLDAAHKPLSDEQKDAQDEWDDKRKNFNPSADDLKKEREMYRGSYTHLVEKRAEIVRQSHSDPPFYLQGWDMLAMMLAGIAFVRTRVLTAERSFAFYRKLLAVSCAIGLPLGVASFWLAWKQGFEPLETVFTFSVYQVQRVSITLGYAAALLMLSKAEIFRGFLSRLGAIGQTAFSNYILHSFVYGFVFYGYGLNLFDRLQRYQLYYVVAGMWVISLVASPLWLRYYRFGPLEWLWRSLTYGRWQPMRVTEGMAFQQAPVSAFPAGE